MASTQAGALFGWQLAWLILLVNVLKYPFFRFGVEYTLNHGESLLQGYQRKGRWLFTRICLLLSLIAAVVNTAGVLLLTASVIEILFAMVVILACTLFIAAGGMLSHFVSRSISVTGSGVEMDHGITDP